MTIFTDNHERNSWGILIKLFEELDAAQGDVIVLIEKKIIKQREEWRQQYHQILMQPNLRIDEEEDYLFYVFLTNNINTLDVSRIEEIIAELPVAKRLPVSLKNALNATAKYLLHSNNHQNVAAAADTATEHKNCRLGNFSRGNFSYRDLRGFDFTGAYLGDTDFQRAICHNANFSRAIVTNWNIQSAEFQKANMSEVFLNCAWQRAHSWQEANFYLAIFKMDYNFNHPQTAQQTLNDLANWKDNPGFYSISIDDLVHPYRCVRAFIERYCKSQVSPTPNMGLSFKDLLDKCVASLNKTLSNVKTVSEILKILTVLQDNSFLFLHFTDKAYYTSTTIAVMGGGIIISAVPCEKTDLYTSSAATYQIALRCLITKIIEMLKIAKVVSKEDRLALDDLMRNPEIISAAKILTKFGLSSSTPLLDELKAELQKKGQQLIALENGKEEVGFEMRDM